MRKRHGRGRQPRPTACFRFTPIRKEETEHHDEAADDAVTLYKQCSNDVRKILGFVYPLSMSLSHSSLYNCLPSYSSQCSADVLKVSPFPRYFSLENVSHPIFSSHPPFARNNARQRQCLQLHYRAVQQQEEKSLGDLPH